MHPVKRVYHIIIEKDESGWFVGSVPELPGCHTQARTLDALKMRMKEAILAYLEGQGTSPSGVEFVGVDQVEIEA